MTYTYSMTRHDSRRVVRDFRVKQLKNEPEIKSWARTFTEAFLCNVCFFVWMGLAVQISATYA